MELSGFDDVQEVGRGGYGVVLRARQRVLQRIVAVKVLLTGVLDGPARQQFEREAQVLGALGSHPHIVSIHAVGFTEDGHPYLVMPFLSGGSLRQQILDKGIMTPAEALSLGVKLSGALEMAHRRGVVHGDVKPDNILFDDYDEPQLCDFGIAEMADSPYIDALVGVPMTPEYAPPEVLAGSRPTAAADTFALAVTLSTMLRGRLPWERHGVRSSSPNADLADLGVPGPVIDVLDRGMRVSRLGQSETAHDFSQQLLEAERLCGLGATPVGIRKHDPEEQMPVGAVLAGTPTPSAAWDEDMLGGDTLEREGVPRPTPAMVGSTEKPEEAAGSGGRGVWIVRILLGLAVLASVAFPGLQPDAERPAGGAPHPSSIGSTTPTATSRS